MVIKREDLSNMTEEELDELVYEEKSKEASEINNQGKDAQIAFILEGGLK